MTYLFQRNFYSLVEELFPLKVFKSSNAFPAFVFAYGSSVFPQSLNSSSSMLDLIVVVEDSKRFHQTNLMHNREHYSGILRFGGYKCIDNLQHCGGGRVIFNHISGLKYGVIDFADMTDDLTNWRDFYIAGRFQKPVLNVLSSTNPVLNNFMRDAIQNNLNSVVSLALLNIDNEEVSTSELYRKISSFSYIGDVRMAVAEDPNKVSNIVSHNLAAFEDLYATSLHLMNIKQVLNATSTTGHFRLADTLEQTRKLIGFLPDDLKDLVGNNTERKTIQQIVNSSLVKKVRKSSSEAALKGLVSAGIGNAISYVHKKIKKRFNI